MPTITVSSTRRLAHIAILSVALAAPAVIVASAAAPIPQVALVVVNVKAVALGFRASQLIGRAVFNDKGEEIGRIDDLIVGQDKVLFAILSVGGFLGIGDHKVALPYSSLKVTTAKIVVPGATKAALQKLPEFKYL